jgi:hypothetical protein
MAPPLLFPGTTPVMSRPALIAALAVAAVAATTAAADAGADHLAGAATTRRVRPDVTLSFHFGLHQALADGNFDAGSDLRVGRLTMTVGDGRLLAVSRRASALTLEVDEEALRIVSPISAGAQVGVELGRGAFAAIDAKLHATDIYIGTESTRYRALTAGAAIGWRLRVWRDLVITTSMCYWPQVWDDAPDAGAEVRSTSGEVSRHLRLDVHEAGFLAGVSAGWSWDG